MTTKLKKGIIYKFNGIDDSYGKLNKRYDEIVIFELSLNNICKAVFINGDKKGYELTFGILAITKETFLTQEEFDEVLWGV